MSNRVRRSEHYEWSERFDLGEGKFSRVFKGRCLDGEQPSGQEVAVKVCRVDVAPDYMEEIRLLQDFDSPYITKYFAKENVYGSDNEVAIVMELADGNLEAELKKEENRHGIAKETFLVLVDHCINALKYLDAQKLSHRDVKPANILIFRNNEEPKIVFKLCDFGLSLSLGDRNETMYTLVGTAPYMLTRMFENMEFPDEDLTYTKDEVDIWATACSFFEAATGRHPFLPNTQTADVYSVLRDLFRKRPPDMVCAHYDAEKRENVYEKQMPEQHNSYKPSFRAILSRYFQLMFNKEKNFLNMDAFTSISQELRIIKEYQYYCLNSLTAESYCDTTKSNYFPRKSLVEAVNEVADERGYDRCKEILEKYFAQEAAQSDVSSFNYGEPFAVVLLQPGVFEKNYIWKLVTGSFSARLAMLYETQNGLRFEIQHENGVIRRDNKNCGFLRLATEEKIPSLVAYLRYVAQQSALADDSKSGSLLFTAVKNKDYDATVTLLSELIPVNEIDEKEESALGYAASGDDLRDLDLVKLLVECGAKVQMKNRKERMPLHNACKEGHLKIVEYLLDMGSDINYKSRGRCTPLMLAALHGRKDVAELLIARGADLDAMADDDDRTALRDAAYENHIEIVRLLLAKGARLNVERAGQLTPLHCACQNGGTKIVTLLIENGADINAPSWDGSTSLMLAIENECPNIAKLLIQKNADVNAVGEEGQTALCHAACIGNRELVNLLLQRGANIDHKNNDGFTALHGACEKGHTNIVAQLLQNGADVNVKTNEGDTPLMLAEEEGDRKSDIIKLLRDHGATD